MRYIRKPEELLKRIENKEDLTLIGWNLEAGEWTDKLYDAAVRAGGWIGHIIFPDRTVCFEFRIKKKMEDWGSFDHAESKLRAFEELLQTFPTTPKPLDQPILWFDPKVDFRESELKVLSKKAEEMGGELKTVLEPDESGGPDRLCFFWVNNNWKGGLNLLRALW